MRLLVKQQNEAQKASLKNELYSKLNVIFHGIDEDLANMGDEERKRENFEIFFS